MAPVLATTMIKATPERVWRALTVADEVAQWDGVIALDVRDDYPQVGQHARWRVPIGPLTLTLHDRIEVVDHGVEFRSTIDVAFVHVDERYRLAAGPDGGTVLTTDDRVSSRVPGLGWLATRMTQSNVAESMAALKAYCEDSSACE